jgi:hypothetical protein
MPFVIALIVLAAAAALWLVAVRPSLKRRGETPSETAEATSCKETCDIRGRSGKIVRYACGHDDHEEFAVDLWGEPWKRKLRKHEPKVCADCLLKGVLAVSVRCGACGFAILPRDPVALAVDEDRWGRPEWKSRSGDAVIVCMRWECGNAPGFCGHWMGDGIRPLHPDGSNAISRAFETGRPQFVEIGPLDTKEGS